MRWEGAGWGAGGGGWGTGAGRSVFSGWLLVLRSKLYLYFAFVTCLFVIKGYSRVGLQRRKCLN